MIKLGSGFKVSCFAFQTSDFGFSFKPKGDFILTILLILSDKKIVKTNPFLDMNY